MEDGRLKVPVCHNWDGKDDTCKLNQNSHYAIMNYKTGRDSYGEDSLTMYQ